MPLQGGNTPMLSCGVDGLNDNSGPRKYYYRILCRERVRHVSREDQHAGNWRNCHGLGRSPRGAEGLEALPS